jgi:O-antigen ligase
MIAAAVVGVGALLASSGTVARLGGTTLLDASDRLTAYEVHTEAFLAAPWRGYGLGTFSALNDVLQTAENHHDLDELHALHNVYLQWLEETGVAGASFMFASIACILAHIWGGLSQRARMLTWLRAMLMASLLVLAHGLVDYALQVPSIAWQWALLLGVGAGIAAPRSREARRALPAD